MFTSPLQRLVAGLAALQLTQAAPSVLEARTITENLATVSRSLQFPLPIGLDSEP